MPLFEYKCEKCGADFELLIFGNETAKCEKCGSVELTKKFSVFSAVNSTKNSDSCSPSFCESGACPSAGACHHTHSGGCCGSH